MEFDHSECNRGKSKQICNRPDKDLQPDSFEVESHFYSKTCLQRPLKKNIFSKGIL